MPKKPQPRPVLEDATLEAAAAHVRFEIKMLFESSERLGPWFESPRSLGESEATMAAESFLLHFRNLRAFLCPSLQNFSNDDVIGSDYLKDPVPRVSACHAPWSSGGAAEETGTVESIPN